MKSNHRLGRLGPVLAALILLLGCGPAEDEAPSGAGVEENAEPVKVLTAPFISYGPFIIADAEGYFDDAGVNVELVPATSASDLLPVFIEGDIDVWAGTFSPAIANAISEGLPARIVGERGNFDPAACDYASMVVHDDVATGEGWDTPETIREMTIGINLRALASRYYFDLMLDEYGLTIQDVEVVDVDRSAMIQALDRRRVDAVFAYEPWVTQLLEETPSTLWRPASEVVPGLPVGITMFGERLLEEDQETGVRFMTAYLRGARQYNEGATPENVEIMAEATRLEPELLESMCWQPVTDDAILDADQLVKVIEYANEIGEADEVLQPDEFWDASFAEDANRRLADGN